LIVGNKVSALGSEKTEVLLVSKEQAIEISGTKQSVSLELVAFISQSLS